MKCRNKTRENESTTLDEIYFDWITIANWFFSWSRGKFWVVLMQILELCEGKWRKSLLRFVNNLKGPRKFAVGCLPPLFVSSLLRPNNVAMGKLKKEIKQNFPLVFCLNVDLETWKITITHEAAWILIFRLRRLSQLNFAVRIDSWCLEGRSMFVNFTWIES